MARGLATKVAQWLVETGEIEEQAAPSIQAIAATCGLLHDVGNPPFGHAGEVAMQGWFRRLLEKDEELLSALGGASSPYAQDFLRYDGNPQTLRLVAHLQMLADSHGLNLTAGTVSALMKYTAASNGVSEDNHEASKPGFFCSEAQLVGEIRALTGTGRNRNPITYLVEASDDVVYSTVDIEDGLRKGVITWDDVKELLQAQAGENVDLVDHLVERSEKYVKDGGLEFSGRSLDEARVQILRTYMIGRHVDAAAAEFQRGYREIMDGTYSGELLARGATAGLREASKRLARESIFQARSILQLEVMGRSVIEDLLDLFWEGAKTAPDKSSEFRRSFPGKLYNLMSANYRMVFESHTKPVDLAYARVQLVADYVAGMTDSFATDLHRQLTNG